MAGSLNPGVTAVTTVGAGTLSAAALLSGNILRSGPVGAFADTTDTAANIASSLGPAGGFVGSFKTLYVNNSSSIGTLTAGAGVTLAGASAAIPANSAANLLVQVTAAGPGVTAAVTITVLTRSSVT